MAHRGRGGAGGGGDPRVPWWSRRLEERDEKVTLQEVALTNLDVRDEMWNVCERASHSRFLHHFRSACWRFAMRCVCASGNE